MARLYLDGQPFDGDVLHVQAPWRQRIWLSWSRSEERPTRVSCGGAPISVPEGDRGRLALIFIPGDLRWNDIEERKLVRVELPNEVRPPGSDIWYLGQFARSIHGQLLGGSLAVDRIGALPLFVQGALLEQFEEAPLDKLLRASLGSLAALCARPRSWLREEEILMPTERVRRVSRRAIGHMARHPEHVAVNRLRVRPQRLLAVVQEEELELYENRAAITLIKALQSRALRRLERVERAKEQIDEITSQLKKTLRYGHYRRARKLGERVELDQEHLENIRAQGQRIIDAYRLQLRTFGACLSSRLGQALRFSTPVRGELRSTNILLHDRNYQVIEPLWRALDKEKRQRISIDPRLDDPEAAYSDFVMLLTARALFEIGYNPAPDQHFPLALTRAPQDERGEVHELVFFLPDEDQALPWEQETTAPPAPKTRNGNKKRTRRGNRSGRSRRKVGLESTTPTGWKAVLHRRLATVKEPDRCWIELARMDERGREHHTVVCDLCATFNGMTDRPDLPHDTKPKGTPRQIAWLHPVELRPKREEEPNEHYTFEETLLSHSVGFIPHHEHGEPSAISLPLAPWLFHSTDRMGRLLLTRTLAVDMQHGIVPSRCPVCGEVGRSTRREGDRACSDEDCGTRWGTRTCECGTVIPKVLPPLPRRDVLEEAAKEMASPLARRHLMETLGGRELLADLCYSDHVISQGKFWVICPGCGHCHERESCGQSCVRCGH